jgi:signal transduction histidine kinase
VPATVHVDGSCDQLTDAQQTCIYRVIQEALTNCARHAKANNVLVSVHTEPEDVMVLIQDDGIGFNGKAPVRGGLGLLGIRERVEALEGSLSISSRPNGGTTIQVQIPMGVPA